ncbi:MAG: cystathionine gamma-synthase [Gemmatimonadota bacterium]
MSIESDQTHRFGTVAIHGGQAPESVTGAITPPIFQTSTYVQHGIAEPRGGYEYARVQNPTREGWERALAAVEGGRHGLAFASGLSAIETVVKRLSAGDHVVSEENTYGGTTRMFTRVLARLGIEFSFVDTRDPDQVRDALRPSTRLVHIETPTNPLMRVSDIATLAEIAHGSDAILCVDNTFASPFNQNPLALGADVVMHSTTKYLNGHSDVIGGGLVVNDDTLAEDLYFIRKSTGAVPGPFDAWLCLRGCKTLEVRMLRHNENGQRIAEYLEGHAKVERVHYPGLASHPQHALARQQMRGFSSMLSIELPSPEATARFCAGTRLFQLAESLGGVESMINVPSRMTHASVPPERRLAMGITDSLVRLSVGIEDAADLIEDLDRALAQV